MVVDDVDARVGALLTAFGDGADGGVPTETQWRRLLARDSQQPLLLTNHFRLRDRAAYPRGSGEPPCTGQEAFGRYSTVSVPTLAKVGGTFLLAGPFEGALVGPEVDWNLVVVGRYPSSAALLALFEDAAYQRAYVHRVAACATQQVSILGAGA